MDSKATNKKTFKLFLAFGFRVRNFSSSVYGIEIGETQIFLNNFFM